MPNAKRPSPADLITVSKTQLKSKLSWYDELLEKDKDYVSAVVEAAKKEASPHWFTIARLLKEELALSTTTNNVSKKIKELARHG